MTKRAWAVCDAKNKPLLHTIRDTRGELDEYCRRVWCTSREQWQRIAKDGGYTIKRISITVD